MSGIRRFLIMLSNKNYAVLLVILFALLLHAGTTYTGGLYADDYIHRAFFAGSQALAEKGILDGIGVGNFRELLSDQFNFFDPHEDNYQAMMRFGMLPWWASQDALLHFFRPVATITHYIDYQLWPDNTRIMHAVSLLWYVLGIACIYLLYRGVGVEKPVALLALLLVVLDHSIFQVVTWIAARSMLLVIAFGFFAVYAYHKSLANRLWYIAGLVALLLSALSAEAVVAICAYLGAYMFTMDKRPWPRRILHILPFALLILVWHHYYQSQGFGAYGVDFYIDPGHEARAFLEAALYRLPGNFFELVSGVDVVSGQIRPDVHRLGFAVAGMVSFFSMVWLLLPLFKIQPLACFFFVGSCLSLVPGLTIALAPRVMIIPFAGMAVVLAYVIFYLAQNCWFSGKKVFASMLGFYTLAIHLLLSMFLAVLLLVNTIMAVQPDKPYGYVDLGVDDIADKPVILLNSYRPFWLAFYAHYMDVEGEPLPASLRVLSSAFYPVTVKRLAQNTLLLSASPAFQLDAAPLEEFDGKAIGHFAWLIQELMGLIRSSRDEWHVGQKFEFPEMTITVNSLHNGKPNSLTVSLLLDMDNYRWSYWNKKTDSYETFLLPGIGQSVTVEGIFSGR